MGWDWQRIKVLCAVAGQAGAVNIKLGDGGPVFLRASNEHHFLELGEFGAQGEFAVRASALVAVTDLPDPILSNGAGLLDVVGKGYHFGLTKLPPLIGFPSQTLRPVGTYGRNFLRGVAKVLHASGGPVDSISRGVHVHPWKGRQTAICQDGRRWACAEVGTGIPWEGTLHAETIGILRKLWAESETVEISISPNAAGFCGETWNLRAGLLQGNYQDCLSLAQGFFEQSQGGFLVDRETFKNHLNRARLFAFSEDAERLCVGVSLNSDGFTIKSQNLSGRYIGDGEAEGTGTPGEWEWNPDFALAWLNQAEGGKIRVGFVGPGKAIVLDDIGGANFSSMISPMGSREK